MRRFWFWLVVVVGSVLLAGCAADHWQTVGVDGDGGYVVAIPQGAQAAEAPSATVATAGERLTLAQTAYRHEDGRYLVAHAPISDEIESADGIDTFLDDVQRWFVEESGIRPLDPDISAFSWSGHPGRAYRFQIAEEGSSARGLAQVLLVEESVYILVVTGPEDIVDERGDRFLASFDMVGD